MFKYFLFFCFAFFSFGAEAYTVAKDLSSTPAFFSTPFFNNTRLKARELGVLNKGDLFGVADLSEFQDLVLVPKKDASGALYFDVFWSEANDPVCAQPAIFEDISGRLCELSVKAYLQKDAKGHEAPVLKAQDLSSDLKTRLIQSNFVVEKDDQLVVK